MNRLMTLNSNYIRAHEEYFMRMRRNNKGDRWFAHDDSMHIYINFNEGYRHLATALAALGDKYNDSAGDYFRKCFESLRNIREIYLNFGMSEPILEKIYNDVEKLSEKYGSIEKKNVEDITLTEKEQEVLKTYYVENENNVYEIESEWIYTFKGITQESGVENPRRFVRALARKGLLKLNHIYNDDGFCGSGYELTELGIEWIIKFVVKDNKYELMKYMG